MLPRPLSSPLFPYTTLFRSDEYRWVLNWYRSISPARASGGRVRPGSVFASFSAKAISSVVHFGAPTRRKLRSEEHTSELQSLRHLVCRLLLEKKKTDILTYE